MQDSSMQQNSLKFQELEGFVPMAPKFVPGIVIFLSSQVVTQSPFVINT
jgi:hypothetical protein